ncbi:DUF499 domain-containing protein [Tsukamurella sp. PLM1]|uniref:DUF499 domain-containing protein n=1 Tax=Tsukamurella sp. PLM1 TaxID=2929795 RepID=UPI0020475874|nr:DUF499 domain-containing protein [Tsukamurella sp. PLM1]BDH57802.1 hypothetical protein MTP03_27410 [Tsukamurella sp. PLM1]
MATTNRERVGRALELLGPALDAFITRVLAADLDGAGTWVDVARIADNAPATKEYSATDPQLSLRFIANNLPSKAKPRWYPFNGHLSRTQQAYVDELIEARNDWAHNEAFDNEKTQRALETASLLLKAVGAPAESEQVRQERQAVAKVANDRFDRDAARSSAQVMVASDTLPAWREVVTPHRDVIEGKFHAAEFAADLFTVMRGSAEGEYGDPAQFFERTFLTEGLKKLLSDTARRVAGDRNAPPVVNLQTNFGGGKTHSMLALWHLASGTPTTAYPDEVQSVIADALAQAGVPALPRHIQRVALVGTQLQAAQADQKDDGTVVRTMWGELAYQLGGPDGHAIVAEADRTGTNPGAALRELLELYTPAIILVDEWVAYARQLVTADPLPGGTFDTQFTFAQTLAEAAKAIPGVQLVISLPASERNEDAANAEEVGGEHGAAALERLKNIVGRSAEQWRSANSEESFEIVRRRLFEPADANTLATIATISKSVVEYYQKHHGEFPAEVTDVEYANRIRRSYPIHPELFDRLYKDWSTLERFQRTRGVLRLMNAIVGRLWSANDPSALIMPATIPLDDAKVVAELTSYLPDMWKAIIDTDIDGADATSAIIDKSSAVYGKRFTARRLARTVFMGATPALTSGHKGIEKKRIFTGTALPGDVPGNFHSALDQLSGRSTYLYSEGQSFWYDLHPNISKTARDYAASIKDVEVWTEVGRRLSARLRSGTYFTGLITAPSGPADIADVEGVRLVVLSPEHQHKKGDDASPAMEFVRSVLTERAGGMRQFQNSVVFLAADDRRRSELAEAVRRYLAWKHIYNERDAMSLSGQQERQAQTRMAEADGITDSRILDTYDFVIQPVQNAGGKFELDAVEVRAGDDLVTRAGKKLNDSGALSLSWNAGAVGRELRGVLSRYWNDDGHITIGELWDLHSKYPYLQRLRDREVLVGALDGVFGDSMLWESQGFAFASGFEGGTYVDLTLPTDSTTPAYIDSTLIVEPARAVAQRESELAEFRNDGDSGSTGTGSSGGDGSGGAVGPGLDPRPRPNPSPTRYFGTVELDPVAYQRSFNDTAAEVIAHLANTPGVNLTITVEIEATTPAGFDDATRRTVSENGNTLKFVNNGFEAE